MKRESYEHSKLKKELRRKREDGKKELIWTLNVDKKEQIEALGYRVEPYLYSIKTRTFFNVRNLYSTLLKDLHYLKKRGNDSTVRFLKKKEKELLDEYRIKYYPVKFKIYLK